MLVLPKWSAAPVFQAPVWRCARASQATVPSEQPLAVWPAERERGEEEGEGGRFRRAPLPLPAARGLRPTGRGRGATEAARRCLALLFARFFRHGCLLCCVLSQRGGATRFAVLFFVTVLRRAAEAACAGGAARRTCGGRGCREQQREEGPHERPRRRRRRHGASSLSLGGGKLLFLKDGIFLRVSRCAVAFVGCWHLLCGKFIFTTALF